MRSSIAEERPIAIPFRQGHLLGSVSAPAAPAGVALIAADRGHSRQSPPCRALARSIRAVGLATVMVDLVSPEESADVEAAAALRVDVEELAARLHAVREWLRRQRGLGALPLTIVGVGGAGAAALYEAACDPRPVAALVVDCRWPDLAGCALDRVRAPVLFVAEEEDPVALDRIAKACLRLRCEHGLARVAGLRAGGTREDRALAMGRKASIWLREHGGVQALISDRLPAARANRRGAG